MFSSREDFNESWLTEMPSGIGQLSSGFFNTIKNSIYEFIDFGIPVVSLPNGYKKAVDSAIGYYWHETNDEIDIAVELSVKPQSLVVNGVGKPAGSQMHATDLYNVILNDTDKSIRLMSDEVMSDAGLMIWIRLLNQGHTISVYDRKNPGAGLTPLRSQTELKQFFQHKSPEHRRYQFVLSETGTKLAETIAHFNTRRMRELSGLL